MPRVGVLYDPHDLVRNRWFADRLHIVGSEYACEVVIATDLAGIPPCDAVICRDRSLRRRVALGAIAGLVVNPPLVALVGNDKLAQAQWLDRHGFPRPESLRGPTVGSLIEKPRAGHGGSGVRMLPGVGADRGSLDAMWRERPVGHLGRSVRCVVLFGELLGVFERVHPSDVRANVALGAVARPFVLEGAARALVGDLARTLGPGYYGIDLLFEGDAPVIGELEDVVGARSLWWLGITDPARQLMRAVLTQLGG